MSSTTDSSRPSEDTVRDSAVSWFEILVRDLEQGMGCFAHVIDTEGNRVRLHAQR
jgi:predicted enzyme related to lactoylglutathione lyase